MLEPVLAAGVADVFAGEALEACLEKEEAGRLDVPSIGATDGDGALLENLPELGYLALI